MTTFQKIHGLRIAEGGSIQNASFEPLDIDPALTRAGRVWFNTTVGKLKISVEDPLNAGQFIGIALADDNTVTALSQAMTAITGDVSGEIARALLAESDLQAAITSEAQTREAADLVLITAVETEVLARTTAIATLANQFATNPATGLANEVAARDAAIAASAALANSSIAAESATRVFQFQQAMSGIDAVQAELNATQAGAGLDVNGDYVVVNGSNYIGAANSLAEATTLLDTALKSEATDRVSGDSANSAAIAAETLARVAGDAALQTQLEEFVNAAIGSNEIADQVEAAARIAADIAIQTELNATQTGAGLGIDGTFIVPTGTAYIDGATTIANASVLLDIQLERVDTALTAEIANRIAGDDALTAAIQAETTSRGTAIATVQGELNTTQSGAGLEADGSYAAPTGSNYLGGTTSLKTADAALDAALKALADNVATVSTSAGSEATRALAAEAALEAEIGVVNTAMGFSSTDGSYVAGTDIVLAGTTSISGALDSLANGIAIARSVHSDLVTTVENQGVSISDFKAAINATLYTFKADTPSATHTIVHNLNSEFIAVTIMVEGDDGVFRNDIVPYEEGDDAANEIVISLSDARIIKVSIQRLDQIA